MRNLFKFILITTLINICTSSFSQSPTVLPVPYVLGTQSVCSTQVTTTLTGYGMPSLLTAFCTGPLLMTDMNYWAGRSGFNTTDIGTGDFYFEFNPPVSGASLDFWGIDNNSGGTSEEFLFEVNGVAYPITSPGSAHCGFLAVISPGGGITGDPASSEAIFGWRGTTIPGPITSLRVTNLMVGDAGGAIFNLNISDPCVDSLIVEAGNDIIICEGQTVILSGSGNAVSYTWDNGAFDNVSFTPSVGVTVYTVTGMDALGAIVGTDTMTVTVSPLPTVDAGSPIFICNGEDVTLTAVNPDGANISWDNGVTDGDMVSPLVTTTYEVTADNLGCISTDDVTITIEDQPEVSFFADVFSGCEPLTVTFTNTSITTSSLVDCVWDIEGAPSINSCGDIVYTFDEGGTYDVTLTTTSENGCTASVTYDDYIYVEDVPVASFTPSSTQLTNLNKIVVFDNTSIDATSYEWSFGDDTGSTTQESPAHLFPDEESGVYLVQLIATSPLGCADTAYAEISIEEQLIYYIPNTFTPDGDDFNQTFKPIFTSGYDPYDFTMLLFNRWGEVIWESHDDSVGWDGTYGGRTVQEGVYTWTIEFKTSESDERISINGHVNLIK